MKTMKCFCINIMCNVLHFDMLLFYLCGFYPDCHWKIATTAFDKALSFSIVCSLMSFILSNNLEFKMSCLKVDFKL